jgi:membrane protein implicated in regulation of membrane protease activity
MNPFYSRLTGAIIWLGVLVVVTGLVLTLMRTQLPAGLLMVSTGLLIVVSMTLMRRGLARKSAEQSKKN